jgi:TRAP-type C4-dicarboxylate transport system substrate-binding protein
MNIMAEMNREIQEKSGGQVAFRFYAGGVAGDERDVIRKIRINQLHGSAFSGFGLGEELPEIRVLELPLLFRDGQEEDHVATALFEHFAAAFAQKHFVLLALNDAGSVYVFSKDPIRTKADMARSKIWIWQGDPLPQAIFKAYGIVPVPLSLPNVLPSLQSGLIDACYGTPLTVLARSGSPKSNIARHSPSPMSWGRIWCSRRPVAAALRRAANPGARGCAQVQRQGGYEHAAI